MGRDKLATPSAALARRIPELDNRCRARIKARELRRRIDNGEDPLADFEEARTAPTVAELDDRFELEHLPRKRPGTRIAYKRTLNRHIRPHFGLHTKVADVDFADIDALHRKVTAAGGPYVANRTVAIMSKMFSLAVRWKMRTDNPAKGIERNAETKRKRYLTGAERARLVEALAAHADKQSANIVRLLLLTDARKGEVFSMRWSNVDLKAGIWTKPGSTTKQKTDHVVPLSAPALQLLNDIHGGGASLPMIGALLGHSDPTTTARYAHFFVDPQRAAAEKVGAAIVAAGKRSGG